MYKKRLIIALFAAISLNACSDKTASPEKNSGVSGATKIVIWEQMEPEGEKVFKETVAQFNQANPQIQVDVVHYPNEDLRTNFQNAALTGAGPDLVYGPTDTIGIFHTSDLIQPIEGFIDQATLTSLDPKALAAGKVENKTYMLPDINGNQIAMVYNKKLVPTPPTTWADFVTVTSKLQDPSQKKFGFAYFEKEPYWFVGFYQGFGGKLLDDNNNPTLNNPAMVSALQFVHDIQAKYHLGFKGMDYDQTHELFKTGNVGIILNGPWSWQDYTKNKIDLGVAPMAALPNGKIPIFLSSTKGFMISKNDAVNAKKAAINQFFAFDLSPDNNAKYALSQSQLPTVTAALDLPNVKNDSLIQASIKSMQYTTPMPIAPQMRAVWDAIRPNLDAVINGQMSPAEASKKIQLEAVQGIKTIQGK